ncbi:hypothetical protein LOC67_22315 [Stieleria sp. JC731]|uniref:hypothetical protein n=1 Tax=Stieleria sp. JC731 TaxID=2894195 RepID=UPI001E5D3994|nr:hypothetical protein [Stieleria sp. JC731]MCC9603293.1 hypothetical protein [Stieleria sp. JC731]
MDRLLQTILNATKKRLRSSENQPAKRHSANEINLAIQLKSRRRIPAKLLADSVPSSNPIVPKMIGNR